MFLAAISCLREARGRFWKAGEKHIQTQPGETKGPIVLTNEATLRVRGLDPPINRTQPWDPVALLLSPY